MGRLLEAAGLLGREALLFPENDYSSPTRRSQNPRLFWELDPESPLVNSAGFRDLDYAVERAPGTFRILALGDSVTFGRGVPLEATFAKVLERSLNEDAPSGIRYEVLNFGVGGYNTDQEVELYRVEGRKYAPDLVLITYVLNDPISLQDALRGLAQRKQSPPKNDAEEAREKPERSDLASRSVLVSAIRDLLRQLADRQAPWRFPETVHADAEGWGSVTSALQELASIARQDRTPVLVVLFPLLADLDDYPYLGIHRQVANEARRHGFEVLDLHPMLREWEDTDLRIAPRDRWHPNARGHREIARGIHAHLLASDLLANPPRGPH